MDKLRIYVCGHDDRLQLIPKRPFLRTVNLNELQIGKYQDNQLAESRLFLSDTIQEPVEYIGFVTATWKLKWPSLPGLQMLDQLPYEKNICWYAANEVQLASQETWFHRCEVWYPSLIPYIREMAKFSGLSLEYPNTPICNNFVFHWDMFQIFIKEWKKIFDFIYENHSPDDVAKALSEEPMDQNRLFGYVLERISMLILSNMTMLEFKQIGFPNRNKKKLPFRFF